jgi:Arc/MetJ-type ribon-helix-helix transcriptional regulator
MPRKKISATIPEKQLRFIDRLVEEKRFYNRSHAIEKAVDLLMKEESSS